MVHLRIPRSPGRRIAAACAVVVWITAFPWSALSAEDTGISSPATANGAMTAGAAKAAVAAAVSRVEEIRGLTFKRPVEVEVVGDVEIRAHAARQARELYGEKMLHAEQAAYALLGLIPPGTDMLAEYLAVLEEQVAGFYDPSEKAFFLLDDVPATLAPLLAAHELTHALEDQHFDLDRRLTAALPDEDRAFAVSAVSEGSAMLVMAGYTTRALADGEVSPESLGAMAESEAARGERLHRMPPALRRPLLGAYLLGMSFLARGDLMAAMGRFPAGDVNRCYRQGPVSSEQILHPEKFWDPSHRDDPTAVARFHVGRILGRGWSRTGHGVLGELVAGALVGAPTPSGLTAGSFASGADWSNAASQGWDGDRWELWTRGARAVVLLGTVWDSPEDAREFAAALPARSGATHAVDGSRVAVVAGDGAEKTAALLDAVLRGSGSR